MKHLLFFCAFLVSLGAFSCKKSSAAPCGSLGWGLAIQDEINNLSAAASAYSQDQSPANCESYKKAYADYIDALKGWEDCLTTSAERDDWQEALEDAEQDIQNIQC